MNRVDGLWGMNRRGSFKDEEVKCCAQDFAVRGTEKPMVYRGEDLSLSDFEALRLSHKDKHC